MESIYTQTLKLKNISCYNNAVNNQEIEAILLGNESAIRYIYEYFQSGHKEEVVADWIKDISAPMQARNLHAVNVYFISLVLCEQMGIQDEMKLISKNGILYPFKYLFNLFNKYLCISKEYFDNPLSLDSIILSTSNLFKTLSKYLEYLYSFILKTELTVSLILFILTFIFSLRISSILVFLNNPLVIDF